MDSEDVRFHLNNLDAAKWMTRANINAWYQALFNATVPRVYHCAFCRRPFVTDCHPKCAQIMALDFGQRL